MPDQDAVIAYCPRPTGPTPEVDLYHVTQPDHFTLYDLLTEVPCGNDGYALPTIDEVATNHGSPTPDLLADGLKPTRFSDRLDMMTVGELYLVHPTGVYLFYALSSAHTYFRLFENAVTVTIQNHPPNATNPTHEIDRTTIDHLDKHDHTFTVLTELTDTLLALGRRALADPDPSPPTAHEGVYGDADVRVEFTDVDPFRWVSHYGILVCLRTPTEATGGLTADLADLLSFANHIRTAVANDLHKRIAPHIEYDEHNPEISPYTEYDDRTNPFNAYLRSDLEYLDILHDEYGARLSPLSSSSYGDAIADRYDVPESAILPDTSLAGTPIPSHHSEE